MKLQTTYVKFAKVFAALSIYKLAAWALFIESNSTYTTEQSVHKSHLKILSNEFKILNGSSPKTLEGTYNE